MIFFIIIFSGILLLFFFKFYRGFVVSLGWSVAWKKIEEMKDLFFLSRLEEINVINMFEKRRTSDSKEWFLTKTKPD